jgi:hypothetical protein
MKSELSVKCVQGSPDRAKLNVIQGRGYIPPNSADAKIGKDKKINQCNQDEENHQIIEVSYSVLRPVDIFPAILAPTCTLCHFYSALRA